MATWRGREIVSLDRGGIVPGTREWAQATRFHSAIGQLVRDWASAMEDFTYAVEGEHVCCILKYGTWMCQIWLTNLSEHSPPPTVNMAISKLWAATAIIRECDTIERFAEFWKTDVDDVRDMFIEYVELASAALVLHPDFGDERGLKAYTDGLENHI